MALAAPKGEKHDDYWKLRLPRVFSVQEMRDWLESHNYHVGSIVEKYRLRNYLRRANMGLMSYHKCSNDELRRLIAARKIDVSELTEGGRKGQRGDLLEALDKDDMSPKFRRFIGLPAELRNAVYKYCFAEFEMPIYAPSQPPISMTSSLIRRETLPVFFNTCRFDIRMSCVYEHSRAKLTMGSKLLLFVHSTLPQHLATVRHLRLTVNRISYDTHTDIDFSQDGESYTLRTVLPAAVSILPSTSNKTPGHPESRYGDAEGFASSGEARREGQHEKLGSLHVAESN